MMFSEEMGFETGVLRIGCLIVGCLVVSITSEHLPCFIETGYLFFFINLRTCNQGGSHGYVSNCIKLRIIYGLAMIALISVRVCLEKQEPLSAYYDALIAVLSCVLRKKGIGKTTTLQRNR